MDFLTNIGVGDLKTMIYFIDVEKGGVPLDQQWVGAGKQTKSTIMDVMEFNGKDYCEIPLTNSIVNTLDGSFSIEPW